MGEAVTQTKYRAPGVLGSGQVSLYLSLIQRLGSNLHTRFYLLQVLHKVMVVAGLQRVPEEHDVWREVQTLQVMGEGREQILPVMAALLFNSWLPVTSESKGSL